MHKYKKYTTYEHSHLTPKLIINKFDFTAKTKALDIMRINYTIKDDIVFSQSLEKEYHSYLITHPTYTGYIVRWHDNGEEHIEGLFIDNKKMACLPNTVKYVQFIENHILLKMNWVLNILFTIQMVIYKNLENMKKVKKQIYGNTMTKKETILK